MAYEKQTWEDYPSTNTPITSDRLNHIEQGIYDNSTTLQTITTTVQNIIASGSNANGNYVKYSDGTMICYGSTSLNEVSVSDYYSFCKRTNSLTITFPMEFDEVPNVTITNQGFGIFSYTINNITANNFSYYAFTYPSASNASGSLQYVAIGKWK